MKMTMEIDCDTLITIIALWASEKKTDGRYTFDPSTVNFQLDGATDDTYVLGVTVSE